jgi:hypothetical protein
VRDFSDAFWQMLSITVNAVFGIVLAKVLFARFYVPGISPVVAAV